MTINLPPRRELPADLKERMRPVFSEVRTRRNHLPLAAAAGAVLLIAAGVAITGSVTERAEPAIGHVVSPAGQDVDRCRAALNDPSWYSTKMVVFGLHKVLVGEDGRFCALTRSRAAVMAPGAQPLQLGTGSLVFRTEHITAGVPPRGTRQVQAREVAPDRNRASTAAVVTPDFFVTYTATGTNITEMVFDDRPQPVAENAVPPLATTSDSFDSGDSTPRTPANFLARCVDNAFITGTGVDDLQGWEPLMNTDISRERGMLLAHRDHREWATCTFSKFGGDTLAAGHNLPDNPAKAVNFSGFHFGSEYVLVGRTGRLAKTIELFHGSTRVAATDVADGFFIATVPLADIGKTGLPDLQVLARDAGNQIVYQGPMG